MEIICKVRVTAIYFSTDSTNGEGASDPSSGGDRRVQGKIFTFQWRLKTTVEAYAPSCTIKGARVIFPSGLSSAGFRMSLS